MWQGPRIGCLARKLKILDSKIQDDRPNTECDGLKNETETLKFEI